MNKAAESEIKSPKGIVRVVFNNKQVIGKRYRVKADQASVPAGVITSSAYLIIDDSGSKTSGNPPTGCLSQWMNLLLTRLLTHSKVTMAFSEWLATNF